jgi:glyceraldehyde 3-phosphate dehydrogenase
MFQLLIVNKVNKAVKEASEGYLKGILHYSEEPLVSIDYTGSVYSGVFDSLLTQVKGKDLVKVLVWYDNEAGYAQRVADLADYIASKKL